MSIRKYFPVFFLAGPALLSAQLVLAQSDPGEDTATFGVGEPRNLNGLPRGQFKRDVKSLPSQAESRALSWLQRFSFPEEDIDTLRVDDEGGVFYVDTHLPDADESSESASGTAPDDTLNDAFALHSRPGAANTVFLDFDGHVIEGTAWNGSQPSFEALPYDLDGDPSMYNATERGRIADIWHKVAEDLVPFDIDVTTEEPAEFNHRTGRILVTRSVDGAGADMPGSGGSGAAYVDVFADADYHTHYSPALVFYDQLADGDENYVAEAASHVFGHSLGLSHDGITGGDIYYRGHGDGLTSWAPIMGNSYHSNVTQWSMGAYDGANQREDDLALIGAKLGFAEDDHGDDLSAYARLNVAEDGAVVSSNPELDPHNVLSGNKGNINSSGDVDVFSFVAGSGTINLSITPVWDAFYRSGSNRSANLDIRAELQDVGGFVVASSSPGADTSAAISAEVSEGTYRLLVTGAGDELGPDEDYGSLGQYFVNGTVPPPSGAQWTDYEDNPVIRYSDVVSGILWNDPSVLKEESGYRMWLSGGDPTENPIVVRIYEAWSENGIDWDIDPTPVLEPGMPGDWDALRTETPSVIRVGDTYHMYYSGCTPPCNTGIYEIGHAISADGTNWVKDPGNPVVTYHDNPLEWGFYTVAEPSVVYHEGTYYLYYTSAVSSYPEPGTPFGILLATSTDGSSFEEQGAVHSLTPAYDPQEFRGYSTPMAFVDDGVFHLYYDVVYSPDGPDGFEQIAISHATSTNGVSFTEQGRNVIALDKGWKQLYINGPTVLRDGDTTKMWFAAQTDDQGFGFGIGYATKQE